MIVIILSGPIASYFTNRYGCRVVTIAGALLASAGMALSCVANSIEFFYFTVGILTGEIETLKIVYRAGKQFAFTKQALDLD